MVRFIHCSKGDVETIYITEDLDTPADDYIPNGWTLESDTKYDIEFPPSFPIENQFNKEQ